MTTFTNEQRENLLKLARYLWDLPEDYKHFDMKDFFRVGGDTYNTLEANPLLLNECGAVACAVGHGPAAGVVCNDESHLCGKWRAYGRLSFGLSMNMKSWDWCFSSNWWEFDNTPKGAAKRIFYMLEQPEDGRLSEWCYANMSLDDLAIYANQERL